MAHISIEELRRAIKDLPSYYKNHHQEVSVDQALYVSFSEPGSEGVESRVFEMSDGGDLVLDIGTDGKVYGIEFL